MHSESNFNQFKQELYHNFVIKNKKIKDETDEYVKKRDLQSKVDSDNYYKEHSIKLQEHLKELKKEKLLMIDIKYKQEYNNLIKKASKEIKDELRVLIDKDFEKYAECFIGHILENFENGEIESYKEFEGLDRFDIIPCNEKRIIFRKDNMILKLDVDSILKEYDELIKQEISKRIKDL